MRNVIALIGLMYYTSVSAYAQIAMQDITHNWIVDWPLTKSKMTASEASRFNSMPVEIQQRAEKSLAKRIYRFRSDGAAQIEWLASSGLRTEQGAWMLDDNEIIISVGSRRQSFSASLEGGNLVLQMLEVGSSAVFSTIILTRDNR